MEPFTCPGTYTDDRGSEHLVWSFVPSERLGWTELFGRYEIRTTIRGVPVWGGDLDGLEPEDLTSARSVLPLDSTDELTDCTLTGRLPCQVQAGDQVITCAVGFRLDLHHKERPENHLTLSCGIGGVEFSVADGWFEDGMLRLERALPDGVTIKACVTCLFSDYSPGGHGLMGIFCHRDAKERYLAVRSKADYWGVPVTEDVPETYLCDQYQRRIPGTGYRG